MKMLRSYIFKICVITCLCFGVILAIIKPADAAQSNKAFADWLQTLAQKKHAGKLEKKLDSLKKSNITTYQLIEQASKMISKNNDAFQLPPAATSDAIHQILLIKWKQFQTGDAMAAVPPVYIMKQLISSKYLNNISYGIGAASPIVKKPVAIQKLAIFSPAFDLNCVTPLVSGIAIGAP